MLRYHGGAGDDKVVDFSSPSNPLGPPPVVNEAIVEHVRSGAYTRYPDYEYKRFRDAIAGYYNLDPSLIVPLNGSAEALQLIIPALKPKVIVSVEPTFGDHMLQARVLGVPLITIPYALRGHYYQLDPSTYCNLPLEYRRDSILLTSNPNNPTGAYTPRSVIEELLQCSQDSVTLVLDEAFSDFTANRESLLGVNDERVIVLRSFTKIFAIQGLRAGFLYTGSRRVARLIDSLRQPWNVNSVAVSVVEKILEWDGLEDYITSTVEVVSSERTFLEGQLRRLGLKVYTSQAPFILVKHGIPHPNLNEMLVKRGLYVRDASTFAYLTPYHSRVSVKLREDNVALIRVLEEIITSTQG
jgi:Histidinol-phosphate/aromatic aminotransferase and cobyric acid decarboxylase